MVKEIGVEEEDSGMDVDLDALIAEGMLIKQAQRNNVLGRKNRPEEVKALKSAMASIEANRWREKALFAVFHEFTYTCANHSAGGEREFIGVFLYSESLRGGARRLVKVKEEDYIYLPLHSFIKRVPDRECPQCLWNKYHKPEIEAPANIPSDLLGELK